MAGGFPTYPDPEYLQYLEQAQEMGEDQVAILVDDDDDDDDEDYEEEDGDEEDYNDGEEDGPVPPPPRVSSGSRSTPSQGAVIALSSDNVAEENEVSWKTTEGSETTSSQGEVQWTKGEVQWTRSEIDGLFWPICMDAWTNGGDHQICCLPCGHLYGASCIKRWFCNAKIRGSVLNATGNAQ